MILSAFYWLVGHVCKEEFMVFVLIKIIGKYRTFTSIYECELNLINGLIYFFLLDIEE